LKLQKSINSQTPVDSHLADNLIPWLALNKGSIKTEEVTSHTKTNIYTTEKFLPVKFDIENNTITVKQA